MKELPIFPPIATDVFRPTAAVEYGRWIDNIGNQMAVAGGRAAALAFDNFSATEVAGLSGFPPAPTLTGIVLGYGETILGGTIADRSFVTTDANAATIAATAANACVLGFMPVGGVAGDRRGVYVFIAGERNAGSAIADLNTGTATTAQIATAFNTLLATLRTRGAIAP